jgi:hypothetical protein
MTDLATNSFPDPSGDEPEAQAESNAESHTGSSPAQDHGQGTQGAPRPEPQLDRVEERVLACLVEKAITTPDYYPLTLNSLTAACRQKSNRNPVVDIDEQTVESALERLQALGLSRGQTREWLSTGRSSARCMVCSPPRPPYCVSLCYVDRRHWVSCAAGPVACIPSKTLDKWSKPFSIWSPAVMHSSSSSNANQDAKSRDLLIDL